MARRPSGKPVISIQAFSIDAIARCTVDAVSVGSFHLIAYAPQGQVAEWLKARAWRAERFDAKS